MKFSKSTRLKRGCCLSLCSSEANVSSWCFRMEPETNRTLRCLRTITGTCRLKTWTTSSRWAVVVVFKHLDRFSHKEDLLCNSDGNVRRQHLCSQRELLQRRSQHVLLLDQPLHDNTSHSLLVVGTKWTFVLYSVKSLQPPAVAVIVFEEETIINTVSTKLSSSPGPVVL